jgi:hypothetical protein
LSHAATLGRETDVLRAESEPIRCQWCVIRRIDGTTRIVTTIAAGFSAPVGTTVGVDRAGNVYVSEFEHGASGGSMCAPAG